MMAKRKVHRRKKSTIPLGIVLPIAYTGYEAIKRGMDTHNPMQTGALLVAGYTGFNPLTKNFDYRLLKYGALPLGLGYLAHVVANKVGLNRALGRAGVPWIRI
jgi:hypothetical protein